MKVRPMRVQYTQFDPSLLDKMNMEQIMKLFMQLLGHTAGNVEQALKWLEYLWERHNFFEGKYTIEDFKKFLEDEGDIAADRRGKMTLTAKGEQRIRTEAFEEIFSKLRPDALGNHRSSRAGSGGDLLPETRAFQFGDSFRDVHYTRSIQNTISRTGDFELRMGEDDLEVHEREHMTSSATVIAIDISHSMTLYGEDRITPAKKVAMALTQLIQTRYAKDSLEVILFGDEAFVVPPEKIPFITNGEFHTNTKAGIDLAQKLLLKKKHANKQIFLITDGKPTAIHEGGRVYKNPSWHLDPKIVSQTINSAVHCRRKGVVISTFMLTNDPHLKDFVDRLTQANKGRAFYASLDNLGSFILTDYVQNRRKRV